MRPDPSNMEARSAARSAFEEVVGPPPVLAALLAAIPLALACGFSGRPAVSLLGLVLVVLLGANIYRFVS